MKSFKLIASGLFILFTVYACSVDNSAQLTKLKQQQTEIAQKISNLENLESTKGVESLDTGDFKFVGLSDVIPGDFNHYIRVQGKLDGDQNVAVFADMPGKIAFKYANVGQTVTQGQVLAQIDDQQYKSQLESLETQVKFATDMFDKQKRLWDQKIGSEVQYLQAKTTKESLEQQISSLKDQIEKFKIKSPVDGTIEESNIKVGNVVSPDPYSVLFRVVAFKNLKVSAEVSEAYASKVKVGDKLILNFPDLGKQLESKIDFVSKYINPVNRTFIIESRIANGIQNMKANMIVIIQINDYHSENSIQIPQNVIQTDDNGSYVYVAREKGGYNGAFKQPVVIGNSYNGIAEILNGLTTGDRIIAAGFQDLIDGEYIRY